MTGLGGSFYSPGFRLTALGARPASTETGTELPKDVQYDVERIVVTQTSNGPSQYAITLNNSYLSTKVDRADLAREGEGRAPVPENAAFRRERLDSHDQGAWPRFKYNDFFHFAFGKRLRVDLRYFPNRAASEDLADSIRTSNEWVPMIAGPITDMSFTFEEAARVVVSGQDDLAFLQDKHCVSRSIPRASEMAIVRRLIGDAEFPLPLRRAEGVTYPDFVDDDERGIRLSVSTERNPLSLLKSLAERLDFEVFVEFDFRQASRPLELHFEPYRGQVPPSEASRDLFTLERGRNLLSFAPTIKVLDQYSHVRVRGRHRDHERPEEAIGTAGPGAVTRELHRRPGGGELSPGPAVRDRYFPASGSPHGHLVNCLDVTNQENLDGDRARAMAEATLRRKARELLTITAATIGLPRLRPGNHVEIRGMRPPFDGYFYVTKAVHTFSAQGYRTEITGCRPGMELPSAEHRYTEALG